MRKVAIFFASCILNCILIEIAADFYYPQMRPHLKREKLPPCDSKKLVHFLADIQVIDPESIIKQATLNELESLCKKISSGLEHTHIYLKKCEPPFQKDLYLQLIKGVDSLHDKLCKKNGHFITAFRKHHPCCHNATYANCTGPADWVEGSSSDKICSAYKDISHCYYSTTLQRCGSEAARVIQELFNAVVASVITVNCSGLKAEAAGKSKIHANATANTGKKITNDCTLYLCLFYLLYYTTLPYAK